MDIRAKVKPCICGGAAPRNHYMLLVNGANVKTLFEPDLSRALDEARRFLSGDDSLATTP